MQQVGLRIDTFNLSRGRGLARGTCELTEFKPRIGVKVETHRFHGRDRASAIIKTDRRVAKLPGARSMP
jgi:hypothetical protein